MGSRSHRQDSVEAEGKRLVEQLGGRWSGDGGQCRCPAHDDRTPSLSVRPGRTRLLFHCFAGCEASDILRELEARRLLGPGPGSMIDPPPKAADRRSAAALRLWSEARPIAQTPAAAYLKFRGLISTSPQLRYHPRTAHGPAPLTQFRPALIAAVRNDTGLVAVHRTFIRPDGHGLAAVDDPRCGLGRYGSGAVRLGGCAVRFGLAEGIETALSATFLFNIPCWATLGTERFGLVDLPSEVRELHLFLDHDPGGRRAEALARSAFGNIACIHAHYPDRPGDDWNDVLRASLASTRSRGERAGAG